MHCFAALSNIILHLHNDRLNIRGLHSILLPVAQQATLAERALSNLVISLEIKMTGDPLHVVADTGCIKQSALMLQFDPCDSSQTLEDS